MLKKVFTSGTNGNGREEDWGNMLMIMAGEHDAQTTLSGCPSKLHLQGTPLKSSQVKAEYGILKSHHYTTESDYGKKNSNLKFLVNDHLTDGAVYYWRRQFKHLSQSVQTATQIIHNTVATDSVAEWPGRRT